jgi:glucosamine--fructose-6-phosphate aminotransferase (isomerizing)
VAFKESAMSMTPLFSNIAEQAESLRGVIAHAKADGAEALSQVAARVRGCRGRVVLTGMGASFFASFPAYHALESAGIHTLYVESSELLHSLPRSLSADDVAVLVSRSGNSVEVANLLPLIQASKVVSLGVTNVADSALGRGTTQSIVLESAADQMVAIQTYSATVFGLSLIAKAATGEDLGVLLSETERACVALGTLVASALEALPRWEMFLDASQPLYVLGRGLSLGSVIEGQLLFHETAKAPVVAMSCAQFRHGPVEVIARGTRVIMLASEQETRHLDIRLANDLLAMGAKVAWIGPAANAKSLQLDAVVARMGDWPKTIPTWLTPLFEIVPLQVAAYQLALLRGVVPGSFRYTPQVTSSEEGFSSTAPLE